MPCRSDEEDQSALPPPGFSTPTKANRNDRACHGCPDAEGTESESDSDVEKQFEESTGKKRKYSGNWEVITNSLLSRSGPPENIPY